MLKKTTGAGVCWREKTKRVDGRTVKYMEPYACVKKPARKTSKRKGGGGSSMRKRASGAKRRKSR